MSQQNVELVRDAFQALGTGGIEAALSFFAPDVVWYTTDRWPEGRAYRGHGGMRQLVAAFSENFDGWAYELEDIRDADNRVVALTYMTGRIKNSRQSVSQSLGVVVSDFRGATFGEVRVFPTWHQALVVGGLVDGDETDPS
jgi:ketosteroid isomerase-like protein